MGQSLTTGCAGRQILLITGLPASGKTRLAEALESRFHAPLLAKDRIKELLFERLGIADAAWSRRLSDTSFALLFALAPSLLLHAPLLLLEGNFRAGEHEPALQALLQGDRVELAQVLCHVDDASRQARLQARSQDPERHRGHGDARGLIDGTARAEFLQLPGPRWQFDSERAWADEFQRLALRLDDWRRGSNR